jgi:hypothetical protein
MNDNTDPTPSQPPVSNEFWDFLKQNKIWWMTPIILVLLGLGLLILLTDEDAIAPFIYTVF